MRVSGKWLKKIATGLFFSALLMVGVRLWVVPAVITSIIQSRVGGKVSIDGCWIGTRSVGVVGLKVHEGSTDDSPIRARAAMVTTDLTLGKLIRLETAPRRIVFDGAEVVLRIDRGGELATPVQFKEAAGASPVLIARGARLTFRQEGRPEMSVGGMTVRLGPAGDTLSLSASSSDPSWGPVEAQGSFAADFTTGRLEMKSLRGIAMSPEKAHAIPFVPPEVWAHVGIDGLVDVRLLVELGDFAGKRLKVHTELALHDARVKSETLGLTATHSRGKVIIDGAVARLEDVAGHAIDGNVEAKGTLDFRESPASFDVALGLKDIDVAAIPKSWQIEESGVTGRLTGNVALVATYGSNKLDLTGTTGEAVVTGGAAKGIPFKSMQLSMKASGNDLSYSAPGVEITRPAQAKKPLISTPAAETSKAGSPGEESQKTKVELPKALTTRIEFEDVNLARLIRRAEALLGYKLPIAITGRLSLKARATIPIAHLAHVKEYGFHGNLSLKRASIQGVDLGRVDALLDLSDGVLSLTDFRGRLVDRPDGGPDNPPEATEAVELTGPLPPGGFRGSIRALLSPPGDVSVRFEGEELPLGELTAPAFPSPTPLSGVATTTIAASAPLKDARDLGAWSIKASVKSRSIGYEDATLDAVTAIAALDEGLVRFEELRAHLKGKPLSAVGSIGVAAPHDYSVTLDVTDWDLPALLAWLPGTTTLPVKGNLTGKAKASGSIAPRSIKTAGNARFDDVVAGGVECGALPLSWTTHDSLVLVDVKNARSFGGAISASARIPLKKGETVKASATLSRIDAARLSTAFPDLDLKMTGNLSGTVEAAVPADASRLDATVAVTAPDLTFRGLPAEEMKGSLVVKEGLAAYELTARSFGGNVIIKGESPLPAPPDPVVSNASFQAVGFTLDHVWKVLGKQEILPLFSGEGAVNANIRALINGDDAGVYAHGVAEFRDLKWGKTVPIGKLKGIVTATPGQWSIESLGGEVMGGILSGALKGSLPSAKAGPEELAAGRPLDFELRIDRASLKTASLIVPELSKGTDGFGTLSLSGGLGEVFHAAGSFHVPRARVSGLAVTDLKVPIELISNGGNESGMLQLRRWSGRLAGGQLRGDAWFRLGADRSFSSDLTLSGVDLEPLVRNETQAGRPATGRISGRVMVTGNDPGQPRNYRGKVELDLDDASLVSLPLIREINKFLGAAQGGVFEDGDLSGTIARGQLSLDSMTLEGRLVQLHGTGTIGLDGQLNLEVLVNTNQIIPQTGQALVSMVPGLARVLGRGRQASLAVANYLSNRLLKLRVTGTLRNPSVTLDPGIVVADSAVGFFAGVLKLPLGFIK